MSEALLADGYEVRAVFEEVEAALTGAGYRRVWVDGWLRDDDQAVVTVGYSYREVRIRRYLPGHKEKQPQAVHDIRGERDLAEVERFVLPPANDWVLLEVVRQMTEELESAHD